jgi:hypothetical protein
MKIKIESVLMWQIEKFSQSDWRAFFLGHVIQDVDLESQDSVLQSIGLESLLLDIETYEIAYEHGRREAS